MSLPSPGACRDRSWVELRKLEGVGVTRGVSQRGAVSGWLQAGRWEQGWAEEADTGSSSVEHAVIRTARFPAASRCARRGKVDGLCLRSLQRWKRRVVLCQQLYWAPAVTPEALMSRFHSLL